MRTEIKMTIAAIVTLGLCIAILFGGVAISDAVSRNFLDFSYDKYVGNSKTPASGSIEPIEESDYDGSALAESFGKCAVFPERILGGEARGVFFSDPLYADWRYKRGQAFLEWKVTQEIFDSEMERLSSLISVYGKKALRSSDLFDWPCYLAAYNEQSEFEYVLLDGPELTIRYIWLFDLESLKNLLFPNAFAPKKLLKDSDVKHMMTPRGSYNMYWGPR